MDETSNQRNPGNYLPSSITDQGRYRDFCEQASTSSIVFDQFRRHEVIIYVLEHVSPEQGADYLREILKHTDMLSKIDRFRDNDLYGHPQTFPYRIVGDFSPVTLRYIKVLCDLKGLWGSLDDFDICEIGCGYGGQCRIVNSAYAPNTYRLVDLKGPLRLAQTYLDRFVLSSTMSYKTMNELETRSYDLVISNYAFSELRRQIQEVYLKRIILNSKRGYLTMNQIAAADFDGYRREELLELLPNARVMEEVPQTHPKNYIIAWG